MLADYVILKYNKKFIFNRFQAIEYSKEGEKYKEDLEKIFKREIKGPFKHYYYFKLKGERYCFAIASSQEGKEEDYRVECILFDDIDFYPFRILDCDINYKDYANIKFNDFDYDSLKIISENRNLYLYITRLINKEKIKLNRNDFEFMLKGIYSAFPVLQAKDIFFTTDEDFPIDVDICVLSNEDISQEKYYKTYEFTNLVELAYSINYSFLMDFHDFLNQMNIEKIDNNIDYFYWLYKIIGMDIKDIDGGLFVSILDFCTRNLSDDSIIEVFKSLEKNFEVIISKLDKKDFELLFQFLIRVLDSKNFLLISRCQEIIGFLLDDMLQKDADINLLFERTNWLFDEARKRGLYFAKMNLRDEKIEYINVLIDKTENFKIVSFYFYLIIKSLIELDYTYSQSINKQGIKNIFDRYFKRMFEDIDVLRNILLSISNNPSFFANIINSMYGEVTNQLQLDYLLSIIIWIIDQKDETLSFEIRKNIKIINPNILFEEFKFRLYRTDNKVEFFKFFSEEVLNKFGDFFKMYFERIIREYISALKDESLKDEVIGIIRRIIQDKLVMGDETLRIIISSFEKSFDFKDIDEIKDIISWVKLIKKIRKITTNPDIISLIDIGIYLKENKDKTFNVKDVLGGLGRINYLDEFKYKNFLLWTFNCLLKNAKTADDHRMITYFYSPGDDLEFYKFYIQNIFKIYEENDDAYHILLTFLVYFYFYVEPKYKLYGEEDKTEEFNELLIYMFLNNKKINLNKFNEDITKEFKEEGLSVPIMWQNVYKRILKE